MLPKIPCLQVIAAMTVGMAGMSTGTISAWSSVAWRQLDHLHLSEEQKTWIVSSAVVGMLLSTVLNALVSPLLGKKTLLMLSCVVTFTSWLLMVMDDSLAVFLLARSLGGVGAGVGMMVGALYTAEIAEDEVRGTLLAVFQTTVSAGIVLVYCVGPYVSLRQLHAVCAAPCLLSYLVLVWLPESPYFLLYSGRADRAQDALLRLRGKTVTTDVDEEFQRMVTLVEDTRSNAATVKELFVCKRYLRSLALSVALMSFQALSGNLAILAYASEIFRRSGSGMDADESAIALGVVQFAMSVVTSFLSDRAGRRPLLVFSMVGCAAALAAEGGFFVARDHSSAGVVEHLSWLPLVALMAYMVTYSLGLGPVPWSLTSEILPLRAKGVAISIVQFTYTFLQFVVVKTFLLLDSDVGPYAAFWLYACFCAIGAVFVLIFVPETKNKSFQQIEIEFGGIKILNTKVDSSNLFK